ncbi:biopolymer transporter ExbD [Rhodobacteraceae bacterium NNCM2]|nr:biopolymer transporter ExbD [Coraliihabitans acroporae]
MRQGFTSRPRKSRQLDDERILPLINVVFLLLIFFMVVGRLAASDPFEITPPESLSDGAPVSDGLLVAVGANGELALNGEIIDEEALIAQVQEAEATELRLKSDSTIEAVRVIALIERFRASGVETIRLMTVPGSGEAL